MSPLQTDNKVVLSVSEVTGKFSPTLNMPCSAPYAVMTRPFRAAAKAAFKSAPDSLRPRCMGR
ncbi:hypothetical protein FHU10_2754 [Serratia fonticola]|uniref:Uncharacterized protein n=1 Tax=Serratia fonticola TaxID=47917 RepID=A0A542BUS6_SERFO|nr:hypothetical protein FHU09_4955 [Serratia fonticola]TQI95703.1 hypothetical protein FHU11_1095 [Serratia fonticola]TVZ70199.1 hypothetical protein FHU10_2754 [Serratia fonticola]